MLLVEYDNAEFNLVCQSELLTINRSSLYYQPTPPSGEELTLRRRIDELYTAHPYYGIRRISAQLQREGMSVNHKRVARLMHEMCIFGISPGPNLSKRRHDQGIMPYLLRGVKAGQPNHVWGIDITYIRLTAGWCYLVAVLDWYSRYVVSWELDQTLQQGFVLKAVEQALQVNQPQIFNSDQGSHFTNEQYLGLLKQQGIAISMDGRGRALDNVFTERLWRSVKYEEVYLNEYDSPRAARAGLSAYLRFYNEARLHQALGYRPPAEVYWARAAAASTNQPNPTS
jgi:putative transposase